MWKYRISKIMVLLAIIILSSCEGVTGIIMDLPPSDPTEVPPFVITHPVFEIVERPYYFRYAGLTFKFYNQAPKIVDRITVSFLLFDQRTQESPFIGSNKFEIAKWEIVQANENKEIIISLDQFIHIAPIEPYLVDFFYIYEVHYVDGSVWQDTYGRYGIRD